MLEKLTWTRYGWLLLAGLAGFACSQEAREPVEVGAAQVELRSDLALPETPGSSTALSAERNLDVSSESTNPMPATRHIVLPGSVKSSQDPAYRAVKRYAFLPALLTDSKSSAQGKNAHASSWTFADKHRIRGGKGFGVAAEGMVSPGTVHPDDASYYFPTVALNPYSKASEHLEPMAGLFKSRKPLVFHNRATGFAHQLPAEATPPGHSSAFETRLELSPIPETQVYFSSQPKTKVTLAPAKNRLDLMNGNENLNRHRYQKLP
jgi:hypothetical protein